MVSHSALCFSASQVCTSDDARNGRPSIVINDMLIFNRLLEEGCIYVMRKYWSWGKTFNCLSPSAAPDRKFWLRYIGCLHPASHCKCQCRAKNVVDLGGNMKRMVSICSLHTVLMWMQHTLICFWCWKKHCMYNACKAVKRSLQKWAQLPDISKWQPVNCSARPIKMFGCRIIVKLKYHKFTVLNLGNIILLC
jgi:hypothetical protein